MFRRLAIPLFASGCAVASHAAGMPRAPTSRVPAQSVALSRRFAGTHSESADDAEFEFFEDDLWFLDELLDEGSSDLFTYIPEDDGPLLSYEPPRQQ